MSTYWSEFVTTLQPYVPGEQPKQQDLIKLNTNENPYPPSPKVYEALSADKVDLLRFYPDPNSVSLKKTVAAHCQLSPENVFVGNGSDEVLALAFMTFFKQHKAIVFPDITYSFYPVYCQLYGIDYRELALTQAFEIAPADYAGDNGGVIFPNPNAPTGIGASLSVIEQVLKANPNVVVIIDEAYVDFGAQSAVALVNTYPNLLVVQTLSKAYSLAGIRVGYAMGDSQLIEGLNRVKNSFNSYPIDRIAETVAVQALTDIDYFRQCQSKVISTRDWVTVELQRLGCEVLPSQANFVFARPQTISASALFAKLREQHILVRYFNKPRIDQFLRISVGTDQQMQELIMAIEQIIH